MTAGRDLNRLLWAVGEARRLRRAESDPASGTGPLVGTTYADGDEGLAEQSVHPSS